MSYEALKAQQGSDVASATSPTLPSNGTYHEVTGTTTITAYDATDENTLTYGVGALKVIKYLAACPLTHHTTNFPLLGGASRTTVANETCLYVHEGAGVWRELSSTAVSGGGSALSNLEVESYHFLDGSGTTPNNSINAKEAAIAGGGGTQGWSTLNGEGAIQLAGGKYVTAPRVNNMLQTARQFTVACQVSVDDVSARNSVIASLNPSEESQFIWMAVISTGSIKISTGDGTAAESSTGLVADGVTHHVVFTCDGDVLRAYLDGTLVATSAGSAWRELNVDEGMNIGEYRSGSLGSLYFEGKMNAFRMWARALPQAEITALAANPFD